MLICTRSVSVSIVRFLYTYYCYWEGVGADDVCGFVEEYLNLPEEHAS